MQKTEGKNKINIEIFFDPHLINFNILKIQERKKKLNYYQL